ncbi:hypothetical protein [Macrococcus equi]|uniref:hypothetical protein n=1 Tax=Macrococcus equi TaxID=3395462 RepID=UPI0039BE498F
MYEDIKYGGFFTVTGRNKKYIFIAGTDERNNYVTGKVPIHEFYRTFKEIQNED